jgi:hypothetical protein
LDKKVVSGQWVLYTKRVESSEEKADLRLNHDSRFVRRFLKASIKAFPMPFKT